MKRIYSSLKLEYMYNQIVLCSLVLFYGISTLVHYLMPNHFWFVNEQFVNNIIFKQARTHLLTKHLNGFKYSEWLVLFDP